jgi:hypothetical protein
MRTASIPSRRIPLVDRLLFLAVQCAESEEAQAYRPRLEPAEATRFRSRVEESAPAEAYTVRPAEPEANASTRTQPAKRRQANRAFGLRRRPSSWNSFEVRVGFRRK